MPLQDTDPTPSFGGFGVRGVILADQVKSLDWRARNAEVVAPLPVDTIDEVLEKIGVLLARGER